MSDKDSKFDWPAIHADLERRADQASATIEDDSARAQALLRERSAQLAARQEDTTGGERLDRVLVFKAEQESFALALACTQEVTGFSVATNVPGANASILGIINWRGEFVTVFDLALVLELPKTEDQHLSKVIVIRSDEPRIALAIGAIDRIMELDMAALQSPHELRSKHARLFKGATEDGLLVLDENALLAKLKEDMSAA